MTENYSVEETIESFCSFTQGKKYKTIYADPPWQFANRTGKVAPEHKRLNRYSTMKLEDIKALPVADIADEKCHLYLWVPNALLPEGLEVMKAWGFEYKTNIIWEKIRKDGFPDGRGVGFYFRNVTEILLFGIKGSNNRTLSAGRTQVNLIRSMKKEHSRKPDEFIRIRNSCVFRTLRGTGLRESELAGLDVRDVYLDEQYINSRHPRPYILVISKGNYDYTDDGKDIVYLTKDAIAALTEWIKYRNTLDFIVDTEALFLNKNGKRMNEDNIKAMFRIYSGGKLTPHYFI